MLRTHSLMVLFLLVVQSRSIAGTDNSGIAEQSAQIVSVMTGGGPQGSIPTKPMPGGLQTLEAMHIAPRAPENKNEKPSAISVLGRSVQPLKRILTPVDVEPQLRNALGEAGNRANLEIVDLSRFPLPFGQVQFRRDGATPPPLDHPDAPFLWRGTLTGDDGRTYSLWVRLRAWVPVRTVRTKVDLRAGQVISAGDVEECDGSTGPLFAGAVANIDGYRGNVVRRTLRAGTMLQPSMVQAPPRIAHGALVSVLVHSGSAQLTFKALANADGRVGQRISLTNLDSHRNFSGTVLDNGTVAVEASLGANLK
jgi:flagella basal body P-ring formation protein FlgA